MKVMLLILELQPALHGVGMSENSQLMTVAEAARQLGIHRPKLSVLLKDAGVQKVQQNGKDLVNQDDAMRVYEMALKTGRLQPHRRQAASEVSEQDSTTPDLSDVYGSLVAHYRSEIDRLLNEREKSQERIGALEHEVSELKIKLADAQTQRRPDLPQTAEIVKPGASAKDDVAVTAPTTTRRWSPLSWARGSKPQAEK